MKEQHIWGYPPPDKGFSNEKVRPYVGKLLPEIPDINQGIRFLDSLENILITHPELRSLIVNGPPGVGKTTVLSELQKHLFSQKYILLPLAFDPVFEAMRNALQAMNYANKIDFSKWPDAFPQGEQRQVLQNILQEYLQELSDFPVPLVIIDSMAKMNSWDIFSETFGQVYQHALLQFSNSIPGEKSLTLVEGVATTDFLTGPMDSSTAVKNDRTTINDGKSMIAEVIQRQSTHSIQELVIFFLPDLRLMRITQQIRSFVLDRFSVNPQGLVAQMREKYPNFYIPPNATDETLFSIIAQSAHPAVIENVISSIDIFITQVLHGEKTHVSREWVEQTKMVVENYLIDQYEKKPSLLGVKLSEMRSLDRLIYRNYLMYYLYLLQFEMKVGISMENSTDLTQVFETLRKKGVMFITNFLNREFISSSFVFETPKNDDSPPA